MIVGRSMSGRLRPAGAAVRPRRPFGRAISSPDASGPSRSPSPRARRSGWSDCAAPAITRSGGRFSARRRCASRAVCCSTARRIAPESPAEAMARGVGFVSSRRAEEGHRRQSVGAREHLHESGRRPARACSNSSRGSETRERRGRARGAFRSRPRDPSEPVATLSGGNQQKVVVARWMEARGPGSSFSRSRPSASTSARRRTSTISCSTRCGQGMAVLLISSDFEEVERICHRALVFSRGRVVGGNSARAT